MKPCIQSTSHKCIEFTQSELPTTNFQRILMQSEFCIICPVFCPKIHTLISPCVVGTLTKSYKSVLSRNGLHTILNITEQEHEL